MTVVLRTQTTFPLIGGWVRGRAAGRLQTGSTWLVLDRTRPRARFSEDNRVIWDAPVGIGKTGTPTPEGRFRHPTAAAV
jgi:hypothetical protein